MNENIVFVVGAGASKEAHLPTGNELKGIIAELLDMRFGHGNNLISGDSEIVEALRIHVRGQSGNDINPYLYQAWHIRDALPQATSIDAFIDSQRGNEKISICGKLGIVQSILAAERESLLYFENTNANSTIDFSSLSDTWYRPFFQLLTENCTKDELESRFKSVTLIVFNYDRCIEHFLYYALQNYYRVSDIDAAKLIENIKIFHPYGVVGTLPWMKNGSIPFGSDQTPGKLLELASSIKTYTEGTDPNSSEILDIRSSMSEANKLVFLGFAFHKLNLALLTPSSFNKNRYVQCFATTLGISTSDQDVITKQIKDLYSSFAELKTKERQCGPFFKEFWRSLSF